MMAEDFLQPALSGERFAPGPALLPNGVFSVLTMDGWLYWPIDGSLLRWVDDSPFIEWKISNMMPVNTLLQIRYKINMIRDHVT